MIVIPAIDLLDGRCVRLTHGEREKCTVYAQSPIELAQEYVRNGAPLLHVVDLNGAFSGDMTNLVTILELARRFPIEVGGGIRNEEKIERLLSAGVRKVVVSTLLLKDPEKSKELKRKYRGRLVGSLDFKDGQLAYAGWMQRSAMEFEEAAAGLEEIIVTNAERDGTLQGPNLQLLESLRQRSSAKIIAAGGVRDADDLQALQRIGMAGAIVGKAFLEKRMKLRDGFKFQWRDADAL